MNKYVVENTLNSGFKDLEDALHNFSATLNDGIDLILTRNTNDYKSSKLGVFFAPETYLKSI
ncbi:MAG: hypothetical protein ABF321_05985 [Bacteroidia bacterium]